MRRAVIRMTAFALMLAVALTVFPGGLAASALPAPSRDIAYAGGDKRIDRFSDVNTHWARENIAFAVENGIMNGMTEHEFWPNYPMTRAMLVTVLWRLELEPEVKTPAPFSDVEQGSWYSGAVAWACDRGIVEGLGDGRFAPHTPISRQDFTVMLYRYARITGQEGTSWMPAIVFTDDAEIAEYARDSVNWCTRHGIVKGRPNGEFSPRDTTTRAEGCTMLRSFLERG